MDLVVGAGELDPTLENVEALVDAYRTDDGLRYLDHQPLTPPYRSQLSASHRETRFQLESPVLKRPLRLGFKTVLDVVLAERKRAETA